MHDGDVRADGLGDGVELLIGRHDADHTVARGNERAEHMMVRARRAVREHDLVGFDRVIELGNAAAQRLAALTDYIGGEGS